MQVELCEIPRSAGQMAIFQQSNKGESGFQDQIDFLRLIISEQ